MWDDYESNKVSRVPGWKSAHVDNVICKIIDGISEGDVNCGQGVCGLLCKQTLNWSASFFQVTRQ